MYIEKAVIRIRLPVVDCTQLAFLLPFLRNTINSEKASLSSTIDHKPDPQTTPKVSCRPHSFSDTVQRFLPPGPRTQRWGFVFSANRLLSVHHLQSVQTTENTRITILFPNIYLPLFISNHTLSLFKNTGHRATSIHLLPSAPTHTHTHTHTHARSSPRVPHATSRQPSAIRPSPAP